MAKFNEAEAYEQNSSEQYRIGLELIQRLNIKKGSKVLDLGCGTGRLSSILADFVGPEGCVVAIDPNTERLKIAREKHSGPNITYIEADSESIPGEAYDIIFCNFVLHWVRDKESVFQNAQKLLKKGGLFAFCCPIDKEELLPPGDLISTEFKKNFSSNVFTMDVDVMQHYATANGFESVYMSEKTVQFDYQNVNGIIDFFMTHSPGKGFDLSHFNVEKLTKYYGDKYAIISQVIVVIYQNAITL